MLIKTDADIIIEQVNEYITSIDGRTDCPCILFERRIFSVLEIKLNEAEQAAKIIVIGIGGAGNNAVSRMIDENVVGVDFIGINTDKQALQLCKAPQTIQIGERVTGGRGAGAKPEVGEQSANENSDQIQELIKDADMVIVTCGMGGGTGTGATPVVAKLAKDLGILTVGIVTKPFRFESKARMNNALAGIDKLKQVVDTLIVIPNDKLLELVDRRTTMPDALKKADEVLQQTVQGITDIINCASLINCDFADVQTVMKDKGIAHVGIGRASGDDKAMEAAKAAISSPLLETTIEGASHCIIYVSGDIGLLEVNDATTYVQELAGDDANVIFGANYTDAEEDTVSITVIATGVQGDREGMSTKNAKKAEPAKEEPKEEPEEKSMFAKTLAQATHDKNVRDLTEEQEREAIDIALDGGAQKPYRVSKQRTINIPGFLMNE